MRKYKILIVLLAGIMLLGIAARSGFCYEKVPIFPNSRRIKAEETAFGGKQMRVEIYETKAPFQQIYNFYRSELPNKGWQDLYASDVFAKLPKQIQFTSPQNVLSFVKGSSMVTVTGTCAPEDPTKTLFTIAYTAVPSFEEGSRVTAQFTRGGPMHQIDFAPIYPYSEEIANTFGASEDRVTIAYQSKDDIQNIFDYYKDQMTTAYGWDLNRETPIRTHYITSETCPSCIKMGETLGMMDQVTNTRTYTGSLSFKKDGQRCSIGLTSTVPMGDPNATKSVIVMVYRKK